MKQYDAYLFDWDGTIANSFAVWLPIIRRTMRQYHVAIDDRQIVKQLFGRASAGMQELQVSPEDFKAIYNEWNTAAKSKIKKAPLYDGILDILRTLAQKGRKTGLITATVRTTINAAFDEHALHQFFDVVVTGDEVTAHKPDPQGILRALQEMGVAKDRAVMLGDSEKDILAAHNAGIDSVLFFPPEHEPFHNLQDLQSHRPTYTIHSWHELLQELERDD